METKLVVRSGIIAIRFDEKSFFSTFLGFTPHWIYKHYNEYISKKIVNLSTTNEIYLKSDVINGSIVNGLQSPILLNSISINHVFIKYFVAEYKLLKTSVSKTV